MGRRIFFKDFGKYFEIVFLMKEEVNEIVEKYLFYLNKELVEEYNVSKDLICCIVYYYFIKKDKDDYVNKRGWSINDDFVDLVMFDWFYFKMINN